MAGKLPRNLTQQAVEQLPVSGQLNKLLGDQTSLSGHSLAQPPLSMLRKAVRVPCALPLRQRAHLPCAKRFVTTDAASSHTERANVPKVRSTAI